MKIIIVHGICDSGESVAGLARVFEAAGHRCYTPSLVPSTGDVGIPELAKQLASAIKQVLPGDEEFVLVGFSLGAIVARYYLQEQEDLNRVKGYFSICGPHEGTLTAYACGKEVARQLRPKSEFLEELDQGGSRLDGLLKVCYWNRFDLMILPSRSAQWGDVLPIEVSAACHKGILKRRALQCDLLERVAGIMEGIQ